MPESPLISVIIPVYNVEQYLRKCLDSICGQTYGNLEILCVNDGSTDGSAAILEEYAAKDKRIKVITQKNSGVSAARNAALSIARGEWITGVDSDDFIEPDTFEYALADCNNETDLICYGTRIIWNDVAANPNIEAYFNFQYKGIIKPTTYHIKTTDSAVAGKMWRKSLIDRFNHKFPEGVRYEDSYFYYTLAPYARCISYRPDKKYNYMRWADSFMSTAAAHSNSFPHILIIESILDFFQHHPLPQNTQHTDIIAFLDCCHAGIAITPKPHLPHFLKQAQQTAAKYGLLERYPRWLRFLITTPWWLKPFVKHKPGKSYYGLPGLAFLVISRRNCEEIFRLLGLVIAKRSLLPPSS